MAVTRTAISSTLNIATQVFDGMGKESTVTKAFANVKPAATDDNVYATALQLKKLMYSDATSIVISRREDGSLANV